MLHRQKFPLPLLAELREIDSDETELYFKQALSLPRVAYLKVVAAAIALHHAVRASTISYDAAFAMAVFALESLVPSQVEGIDWSHFNPRTAKKLDNVLGESGEVVEAVRKVLLEEAHFKLEAKFVKFISSHLEPDFFRSCDGIRRSDLVEILHNAYSNRSGFVHALNGVEKPMANLQMGRMSIWRDGEPHFTLQGIFYVAFEVLRSLVRREAHSEGEEGVNWWGELPGLETARLSHEYWLWRPEAYQGNDMRERFSDVLEYFYLVITGQAKLIDLRDGIGAVIARFGQLPVTPINQRRLVIGMSVFWSWLAPKHPVPGAEELFEKYQASFDEPSIESLVIRVLGGHSLPWEPDESGAIWAKYTKKRYEKTAIRLPHQVESALRGAIANEYLAHSNLSAFTSWCEGIADDEGQRPDVIAHITTALFEVKHLDVQMLLGIRRDANHG